MYVAVSDNTFRMRYTPKSRFVPSQVLHSLRRSLPVKDFVFTLKQLKLCTPPTMNFLWYKLFHVVLTICFSLCVSFVLCGGLADKQALLCSSSCKTLYIGMSFKCCHHIHRNKRSRCTKPSVEMYRPHFLFDIDSIMP